MYQLGQILEHRNGRNTKSLSKIIAKFLFLNNVLCMTNLGELAEASRIKEGTYNLKLNIRK